MTEASPNDVAKMTTPSMQMAQMNPSVARMAPIALMTHMMVPVA